MICFFFFQAEDGIRDYKVTGVQTCALPIFAANPFEKVNWASHIDKETGRPVETDVAKKLRNFEAIEHWPSTLGAKNWPHAAFNPETGLLYANTMHIARMYKHLE